MEVNKEILSEWNIKVKFEPNFTPTGNRNYF